MIAAGTVACVSLLATLPGRQGIPPLVQSDYCYILLAADRLYHGLGLTSLQPVAPLQPWDWEYDWGFLTQWPMGYPLLVCGVRIALGLDAVQACQWINVAACALGFVGWFLWIKSCVPRGITGTLLSAVAAGCAFRLELLLDVSTDVLLVAMLPFVLLCAVHALGYRRYSPICDHEGQIVAGCAPGPRTVMMALSGFAAGALFWLRYAAIFVPIAIGVHLLIEWRRGALAPGADRSTLKERAPVRGTRSCCFDTRGMSDYAGRALAFPPRPTPRVSGRDVMLFAACAALPIAALLVINSVLGTGSTQARLNLGHTIGLRLSPQLFGRAWWKFTDLGFYDYHRFTHWVYCLWPAALLTGALTVRRARHAVARFCGVPGVRLSALVVGLLVATLIFVTAVFGDKHDYVGLARYYLPVRPLYFVLFVAPLSLVSSRVVRAATCMVLIVACSWLVQREWAGPYQRAVAQGRTITPYGRWGRCFEPGSARLYDWLNDHAGRDLILLSNFHEYIALETGIPALPIPRDVDTLTRWVEDICASRGVVNARVLFVLDPDNKERGYWIAPVDVIAETFGLSPYADAPQLRSAQVFECRYGPTRDPSSLRL